MRTESTVLMDDKLKNLEGVTISVDAGYGNPNSYNVREDELDGHCEKNGTEPTTEFLEEYLKRLGANVVRVRMNNDTMTCN
ncbi:hypothetical protein [Bacillus thuringiensis]|uniref:hypothetical protein n=1 Tax=Bacillus thuringiensis TaxID=1428 RepID=UPI0021D652C3|nr:hypothetical protein [Bacillus thuringiensis]MCU7667374.1 hypothetical protein [Bacillus thuringiensis]